MRAEYNFPSAVTLNHIDASRKENSVAKATDKRILSSAALQLDIFETTLKCPCNPSPDITQQIHLEQELVGEHIDSELLITEGVDARGGGAGGCADLEGDGTESLTHAYKEASQTLVGGSLSEELLLRCG